jgi:Holliday junction resolvasome RuvABC endonuclease subunit
MISLGLDPSMSGFGWCVHNSEAHGPARVVAKGRHSTSSKAIFVTRYIELRGLVDSLLREHPQVSTVGVESPPFGELWSEGLYGLFLFVNEAVYNHRKDVVYFDPLTVKLLAKEDPSVRRGKMFKADMVTMAKADTGITRWNADEADAYHIARFAARFGMVISGEIGEDVLLPSEQHVFLKQFVYKRGKKAGLTARPGMVFKENERFFRFSQLGAT